MKQGWEIKKLGEVATYVNGYAFKPEHWGETGMPIIRIQNLNNPNAEYNYCDADIPEKFVVENGDILISWSASLGVYEWNRGKAYLNQHIFKVVFNKVDINKYFLKYAVNAKLNEMLKDAHGATMKHIVKGDFDNTIIPYPSRVEQERIVAELDCLSGVIEKKREQLKQLDALAQSIFYQMFGDPITNEKGWQVKKFEDCYKLASGNGLSAKQIIDGDYPVYGGNGIVGYHHEYNLDGNNIIIGRVGALCGNVRNVEGKAFITDNAFILTKKIDNDNVFLLHLLRIHNLRKYAREAMQPVISNAGLKNINVIITPLTLQQEFADKIEAIEKQKELIKQSIAETETLFNSRMDYYFN